MVARRRMREVPPPGAPGGLECHTAAVHESGSVSRAAPGEDLPAHVGPWAVRFGGCGLLIAPSGPEPAEACGPGQSPVPPPSPPRSATGSPVGGLNANTGVMTTTGPLSPLSGSAKVTTSPSRSAQIEPKSPRAVNWLRSSTRIAGIARCRRSRTRWPEGPSSQTASLRRSPWASPPPGSATSRPRPAPRASR